MNKIRPEAIMGTIFLIVGIGGFIVQFFVFYAIFKFNNGFVFFGKDSGLNYLPFLLSLLISSIFIISGSIMLYKVFQDIKKHRILQEEGVVKKGIVEDYKRSIYRVNGRRYYKIIAKTEDSNTYESRAYSKYYVEKNYPIGSDITVRIHPYDRDMYEVELNR